MNHFETSYTTHDGLTLYLQAWIPDSPVGGMLLVHGLGEHSGRYQDLVNRMTQQGIAVFTFDGRGHGKSATNGPTAYIDTVEDYLKDIDSLLGKVKNYLPGKSIFLFGHSMGGGLAAAFVLAYKPALNGVVLSSPAIKEAEGTSPILIAISGMVNRFFPKLKVLKLDISGISRIPEEVLKYQTDPLVYQGAIPARTGYELYHMMQRIQREAGQFSLPVLLLHGDADRLTNPNGSQIFHEKAASPDKTLQVFSGGYHELLNDLDRDQALALIESWIVQRL